MNGANGKSLGELISELRALVVGYVRQEVFGPLKGAGRYLKLGLLGGLLGIVAAVTLTVAGLRAAQTAHVLDIDRGAWSWLVYLVVGLLAVIVGVLFFVGGLRRGKGGEAS